MGIGSLRRYHKPLTNAGASKGAPAVASGPTETAGEAAAAAAANEAKLAAEQEAQAAAANADPTGAQSVNPIVQEAGGVEDNPANEIPATIPTLPPGEQSAEGAEHAEVVVGTPVTPGSPEGEQEQQAAIVELADGTVVGDGETVATLPVSAIESTKHGDLERPTRFSSKIDWLAYTAADPTGAPEGYEELNRNQLAELYLGPTG